MTDSKKESVPSKKTASNTEAVLTGTDQEPKPKRQRTRKPPSQKTPSTSTKKENTRNPTPKAKKAVKTPKKSNLRHIVTVANNGVMDIHIHFLKITVNSGKQLKLFGLNDLQLQELKQFVKFACSTGHKLIIQTED